MALNSLHSNGKSVPLKGLRRQPNEAQVATFDRLTSVLRACSRCAGEFRNSTGRRGMARLEELSAFLKEAGLLLPHASNGPPELKPYRDAEASRLAISGRGDWDITGFLGHELLLLFVEPIVLRSIPENDLPYPDTSTEDGEAADNVFRLWDARGLLRIASGTRHPRDTCCVFGSYKSLEVA